ncbi:hypothetical protein [Nocardia jejuensis]|uniref:hypothetical protein n=1 Tax=Nocardia jejuensis TaxID=328049 RepID=UPI00082CEA05|nr:hypothetical protein [Nocardia jejuensis]
MITLRTGRRIAAGAGLAMAAAMSLSTGTATAAAGPISVWVGGGPDLLACRATAQTCNLTAYVFDMSAPVTISVDGQALATGMPVPSPGTNSDGKLDVTWIPKTAGQHVVSAKQGSLSYEVTVRIMDNGSLEATAERVHRAVIEFGCETGSGALGSGLCSPHW